MIAGMTVPGVSRIPVTISGEWPAPPKRDWRGVASSEEPIVAIAFLRWQHHVEWCLSSCTEDGAIDIETRLALFPYDKAGLDVQVNVSIGRGGRRWRSLVASPTYQPTIPAVSPVETGTVALLSRIEGNPTIDFLGLFITKRDTKCRRNRIWHLRPCFHESLPVQLRAPLTYGRTGDFED
ncbi:MAG: hypothetical protein V3W44_03495 [Dehalococcoidales bacterium]